MKPMASRLLFIAYASAVVYAWSFVLSHPALVMGRYTDAWWHCAAADEYARTGVFAKDPFLAVAPQYAQFGLLEFLTAKWSVFAGLDCRAAFIGVLAMAVVAFMGFAFAAGYRFRRRVLDGCVCGAVCATVLGRDGVIGLGLPFALSVSLFTFFASLMVWNDGPRCGGMGLMGAFLRGLLLGVIFDVHAFTGLAAGLFAVAVLGVQIIRQWRLDAANGRVREYLQCAVMGSGFIMTAWPWLLLHLRLHGSLTSQNAHAFGGGVPPMTAMLGAGILVVLSLAFALDSEVRSMTLPFGLWGAVLALFCVPAFNVLLASATSSFMSERVPYVFPYGLVAVLGVHAVADKSTATKSGILQPRRLIVPRIVLVCAAGAVLLFGARMALVHLYLVRTHDYDRHPWGYLESVTSLHLMGKVVLSDPFTSYYARGYLGSYAVTVPRGHASPALDYRKLDEVAKRALINPAEAPAVDAVIIDRVHTPPFAGAPEDVIVRAWKDAGWLEVVRTERVAVMVKPECIP